MNLKSFIRLFVLLLALLSCQRDPVESEEDKRPHLNIAIVFPETSGTKAELPAGDAENAINSLSIWVFRHDKNHTKVGFLSVTEFPEGEGVKWYSIPVDWNFVNTKPNVDIFALANAKSIGYESLGGETKWDVLNNASFGLSDPNPEFDYFGLTKPVKEVPKDGLPMSAMGTNMKVYGVSPQLKVDAVTLTRAVSRFRMVFCKTATSGGGDDIKVDRVVFYGNKIPKSEYVFNSSSLPYRINEESGYIEDQYTVQWPKKEDSSPVDLLANPSPESLIYVNQDPNSYQSLLNKAVSEEQLNDLGYTYFRESDQRLAGRIYYSVNNKTRFREFSMALPGDFARNHTWTLYGYFLSGRNLQLALSVQKWDKADYRVNFSEQALTVTHKFRVDESSVELTETGTDQFDAKLLPGEPARGHLYITTPVSGKLLIRPEGASHLFLISTPNGATIDPETSAGRIDIEIRKNTNVEVDVEHLPVEETSLKLSFIVDYAGREIDADTEAIDIVYRFRL